MPLYACLFDLLVFIVLCQFGEDLLVSLVVDDETVLTHTARKNAKTIFCKIDCVSEIGKMGGSENSTSSITAGHSTNHNSRSRNQSTFGECVDEESRKRDGGFRLTHDMLIVLMIFCLGNPRETIL